MSIDLGEGIVLVERGDESVSVPLASAEAFEHVSRAWLRAGWDAKHVYSFTWLGRPIIQLPEDMVRLQELIYRVRPTIVLETGIAHGGSLVYHASILKAMGAGRVIGVDVDIRDHNRRALDEHELASMVTLIEGDAVAAPTVARVREEIDSRDRVLVILDSNHTKAHVLAELEAYAPLVTPGSYLVAMDGIMGDLAGAPRTEADWEWNNPAAAVQEFVAAHADFVVDEPSFPFNEGLVRRRVTYSPAGWIKRLER